MDLKDPVVGGSSNDYYWISNKYHNIISKYLPYQRCFTENYVDGRKLILIDAASLPKMGIQDFDHIKVCI